MFSFRIRKSTLFASGQRLPSIDGVQLVAKFFLRGEVFGSRLGRVIGQLAIETMVTELSRLLGIGL